MNIRDPQSLLTANVPVIAGTLHGIGVGPGDPELLTMRAVRLIREARVVAYFAKKGRRGHARTIVEPWLETGCEELPLFYPMTTEAHFGDAAYRREVGGFYDAAAEAIALRLEAGDDVALLCEGRSALLRLVHACLRAAEGDLPHFSVPRRDRHGGLLGCGAALRSLGATTSSPCCQAHSTNPHCSSA